jgi:hypothetical protein
MLAPPSQSQASKLHWHSNAGLPQPRWLVKKLLPETGVALLSGQWSTGKTFMGLHLANCIWTGEPFAGQKIKRRGGTLLFAAEAAGDIPTRLHAVARRAGKQNPLPFAWVDAVPKLSDPSALVELIAMAREAEMETQQKFGVPLAVILVDTMSAAAGFADENSAADVQPVMDALHKLARATSTLVIAIDHYGKATNAGTRGSNAKESSADAVLALEKAGNQHVMTVRKLRSGPAGAKFEYSLEPVSFDVDVDGDEITTCIVKFDPHNQGAAPPANAWKGLPDLKQALDAALGPAGKTQIVLDNNGRASKAAPLQAVRQEFYRAYPVGGNQAQRQEARRKAFNRQLTRGRDAGLTCTCEVNGEDFVWIATT